MNQLMRYTIRLLAFSAVCLALLASAQAEPKVIKVHIPFEFNIGNKAFPAGDYSVSQPLQDVMALRNDQGRTIAFSFTHPIQSSPSTALDKPALQFYVAGGQHTLAQVWRPEDGVGQQLSITKSRVAVARQTTVDTDPITGGTKP